MKILVNLAYQLKISGAESAGYLLFDMLQSFYQNIKANIEKDLPQLKVVP